MRRWKPRAILALFGSCGVEENWSGARVYASGGGLGGVSVGNEVEQVVTIKGAIAFISYIGYIYYRWARLTARRYGLWALLDRSYRPRRRGWGVGVRSNPFGRQHDVRGGTRVWSILRQLEMERRWAMERAQA